MERSQTLQKEKEPIGKPKVRLLVDGDIVAYRGASVAQELIDWGDTGGEALNLDPGQAEDYIKANLEDYKDALRADEVVVCLSDPQANWRKELCASYKAHRKDVAKPFLLGHCRQFLLDNYITSWSPRLEADDVMGLLSQEQVSCRDNITVYENIVVSIDKDMRNVPCRLWNPGHPEVGVHDISIVDAFFNHMTQTLVGDSSDGYPGCPGVGPIKAKRILEPLREELAANAKRGSVVDLMLDFAQQTRKDTWQTILDTYEKHKADPDTALLNARLSYILWDHRDYNWETCKVRLWKP
jgi:DNA polymerase-1